MQKFTKKQAFHKKRSVKNRLMKKRLMKKRTNKTNKRTNKRNKTPRRSSKRMKLRGGYNDLGQIFLDIVKNKKVYDKENSNYNYHRQSEQSEQAGWELEDLKAELEQKVGNKERFNQIMDNVDYFISTELAQDAELALNKTHNDLGNGGQGYYDAQNDHAEVIVKLRDLGVDVVYEPTSDEPETKRRKM